VDDMHHVSGAKVIDTILIIVGHMGLRVVADGAETPEQHKILESLGCHYFQG